MTDTEPSIAAQMPAPTPVAKSQPPQTVVSNDTPKPEPPKTVNLRPNQNQRRHSSRRRPPTEESPKAEQPRKPHRPKNPPFPI